MTWFIRSDDQKPHMAGWMLTAIRTLSTGSKFEDPGGVWLSLAICPRCHAVVIADEKHAYGDRRDAHERWHAASDHPVPPGITVEEDDRWRISRTNT